LLSKGLLAFTLEFDGESPVRLATIANLRRVLDEPGVLPRDLPRVTGVAREAVDVRVKDAQKQGLVTVDASSRGKLVRGTSAGRAAQTTGDQLVNRIEQRWVERFGRDTIDSLRASLVRLAGVDGRSSPYPDGWRAAVATPDTCPISR